jgi:HD superfamily phosphohydrolase
MPTWGLTKEQRDLGPWGLHPKLLDPSKVTTDPVQRDVYTTTLEQFIIDTAQFQRLRRVRQLGTSHLVYPGATQSRFSHSLGALRVAQDLLDGISTQREGVHPVHDLFGEWERHDRRSAQQNVARVIVLARLGALLHDLCHLPYGHSIEDDLQLLPPHDEGIDRFTRMWEQIGLKVRARVQAALGEDGDAASDSLSSLFDPDGELLAELTPLIISKGKTVKPQREMQYPFVADLVGNTICADLLDYLRRDHLYTGLPVSLGTRFTTAFFVTPSDSGPYSKRMAINIMREGHERTDVISELLKALRFRYELSERVLVHHTKLAADAMVGKLLELYADATWLEHARALVEQIDDHHDLLQQPSLLPLQEAVESSAKEQHVEVKRTAAQAIEKELLEHGDDGLLEALSMLGSNNGGEGPVNTKLKELRGGAAGLASRLLKRDLFKVGARVGTQSAAANRLYGEYGQEPRHRRALQDEAQRFAGIDVRTPRILIWLPDPKMRLKQAEVLVDNGRHVNSFVDYERSRSRRGSDIYDAHERLWATWVYFDPSVQQNRRNEALVYLARRLGVCWERMEREFGSRSSDWVDRLALSRFIGLPPRHQEVEKLLRLVVEEEPVAARGLTDESTFQDHLDVVSSYPPAQQAKLRNQT